MICYPFDMLAPIVSLDTGTPGSQAKHHLNLKPFTQFINLLCIKTERIVICDNGELTVHETWTKQFNLTH
jgi:hypothetical protein